MIPYDFSYYRPDNIKEAVDTFKQLDEMGMNPVYYSGGTEIITMARVNNIQMGGVIDLKNIPECRELLYRGSKLIIGSCVTLNEITESGLFPLLGKTVSRIADHTVQCKVTIGGNIAGTIIYKEGILPFLLSDSSFVIAGINGIRKAPIIQVFDQRLNIQRGEFILQIITDSDYVLAPYVHVKKTKVEKIDYPLLTVASLKKNNGIRVAFSGLCNFPFRSEDMEKELNDNNADWGERIIKALNYIPAGILNDISGSDMYRKFVLKDTLMNVLKTFEGA